MTDARVPSRLGADALELLGREGLPAGALRLPATFKYSGFAASVVAIQAIIAHRREFGPCEVVLPRISPSDLTHYLARHDPALVATLLASRVRNSEHDDVTEAWRPHALQALGQKQAVQAGGGSSRSIIAVDYLRRFARPSALYSGLAGMVSESDRARFRPNQSGLPSPVDDLMTSLAKSIGSGFQQNATRSFSLGFLTDIGDVLFELFQNTDRHARADGRGVPIQRSIRGFQMRTQRAGVLRGHSSHHFDQFLASPRTHDGAAVVELSVFDSGPGVATHVRNRGHMSSRSVPDLLGEALNSSLASASSPTRLDGLRRVQEILNAHHGFLLLRSDGVMIERDFGQAPYEPRHEVGDLSRWEVTPAVTHGTVVSIAVPLGAGS